MTSDGRYTHAYLYALRNPAALFNRNHRQSQIGPCACSQASPTHDRTLTSLAWHCLVLLTTALLCAPPAQGQYWGDQNQNIPETDLDFSTRNRVLLYIGDGQPYNSFFNVARRFQIRFVGLNGTSPRYTLVDHYQGQVYFEERNREWGFLEPPYATPFSAGCNPNFRSCTGGTQHVDVLNIPIPSDIGPIVGVVLDGPGGAWMIDRLVVDGRTFRMDQAQGPMGIRYSTHFVLGGTNGPYQKTWPQGMNARAEQARVAYGSGRSVLASEQADDLTSKIITLRVALNDISYTEGGDALAPELYLTLQSSTGQTFGGRLRGPMVRDQRWVSINVPRDFELFDLQVDLASSSRDAWVREIGLVVEEELAPEVLFQGSGRLAEGSSSLRFARYQFAYADLADSAKVGTLRARTNEDVFGALTRNPNDRAALSRFRASVRVLSRFTFDEWFLGTSDAPVSVTDLLRQGDALFTDASAVSEAWHFQVRRAVKKAMDDRTLAMEFVERLEAMATRLDRVARDELAAAKNYLDLDTDVDVAVTVPATAPDPFTVSMGIAMTALEVVPVITASPQSVVVVQALMAGIAAATTGVAATGDGETEVGRATVAADQSRNQQTIAFGSATLDFGADYDRTMQGFERMRALVVRDMGLLHQMAEFEANYARRLASSTGGMVAPVDAAFRREAQRAVRATILRTFLPIRGVLVGEPAGGFMVPYSLLARTPGEALHLDGEVDIGYGSPGERYQARDGVSGDSVLAYSAYVVHTRGSDGTIGIADYAVPVLKAQRWKLGIGSPPRTPVILAQQRRQDGSTLWDYVTEALHPIEVFNLLAYNEAKLVTYDVVYACDTDDPAGWRCLDEGSGKERYTVIPARRSALDQPGVRTMTVAGAEGRTKKLPVDDSGRFRYTIHQVMDNPDVEDDEESAGTLIPTMWVIMYTEP